MKIKTFKRRSFTKDDITFVVIGKNEASNLERCFESIKLETNQIIYVDSNSTDKSIDVAKKCKIKKIVKFKSNFYTASLARFIGAKEVKSRLIHFLDGDMKLHKGWINKAVNFLNSNVNAVVVHGYKKEYKNSLCSFVIKKDKKDWQSDYLQGSYLIKKREYFLAGELDYRFPGEEERDLYVRLYKNGGEVWYHDCLMASHYDFKKRGVKYLLFSPVAAIVMLPFFKYFNFKYLRSYIFVYRNMLITLFTDILSLICLLIFNKISIVLFFVLQLSSLFYAWKINRLGYFIIWKSAFLNLYRIISIINRKLNYKIKIFY